MRKKLTPTDQYKRRHLKQKITVFLPLLTSLFIYFSKVKVMEKKDVDKFLLSKEGVKDPVDLSG